MEKWKVGESDLHIADSLDVMVQLKRRREALGRLGAFPKLPIGPQKRFCGGKSLVALPYYSIEVVFNMGNVYGNLRNHDPAFIDYDFQNPFSWKPLLYKPEHRKFIYRDDEPIVCLQSLGSKNCGCVLYC